MPIADVLATAVAHIEVMSIQNVKRLIRPKAFAIFSIGGSSSGSLLGSIGADG
ncbi:hypothetical protein [Brucella pseudogrignonensis]|uniref:hypothetical protein n=1 Tax=Brucella pseudogrignonensis TaxID=419475 RepID=UPI003ECE4066